MALASVFASVQIAKRTSWGFLPLLLSCLLSGVYRGMWAFNGWMGIKDEGIREGLLHDAIYAYLVVLLGGLFLAWYPKRLNLPIRYLLNTIFYLSVGYTILQYGSIGYERGAFSGNASMNGCLIACLLPVSMSIWKNEAQKIISFCLAALAIYMTDASLPMGVLAVVCAGYFIAVSPSLKWAFGGAAFIFGSIIGVAYNFTPDFLNSSGRWKIWKQIITIFWNKGDVWFGEGIGGTFHIVSMIQVHLAQIDHNTRTMAQKIPLAWIHKDPSLDLFPWLHNDWLQTFFELGFIGLGSALLVYAFLCIKAYKRPALFASLLGFGAMATFNYPCRLVQSAICIICLVALILRDENHVDDPFMWRSIRVRFAALFG